MYRSFCKASKNNFPHAYLVEHFRCTFYSVVQEGGVRVCGIAVLGYFWCGVAVIFVSKYGIAVFRVQAVCGKLKFYVAVGGEKSLCRGDLLFFMTRGYKS